MIPGRSYQGEKKILKDNSVKEGAKNLSGDKNPVVVSGID